jgi:hypothetical protein
MEISCDTVADLSRGDRRQETGDRRQELQEFRSCRMREARHAVYGRIEKRVRMEVVLAGGNAGAVGRGSVRRRGFRGGFARTDEPNGRMAWRVVGGRSAND